MPFVRTFKFAATLCLALVSAPALAGEAYTLGDLSISMPTARATLPNAPVGGGFVTITNSGAADDRLVAASSSVAGHVEIHEMAMVNDIMKMRELEDGLAIPAGETVVLMPGGYHLMFMELKQPLVEGEDFAVTLVFENAGEIEVTMAVGPRTMGSGQKMKGHATGQPKG